MSPQLHFLLLPLMTQSHMTGLAKLLAQRGLIVTIITTPRNMIRYESTMEHAVEAGLQLRVIPLEFPGEEAGLPGGYENVDSLPSMDLVKGFFAACEMLEAPLQKLMAELHPKPNCIVSTNALPWTHRVSDSFNIPWYIFETISCFAIVSYLAFDKEKSGGNEKGSLGDQIERARRCARGSLVNSFEEMEGEYVEEYKKVARCIGPMNAAEKSEKASIIDDQHCRSHFSGAQIKEIGLGLEASGLAFIWAIRGLDCSSQVLILSLGGFLTHCGWNSTLEGVRAGVPMITWPMFADQFYNQRFIVHVLKIGVEVDEKKEAVVKWDRVKKSIEELMDEEEEGRERRRRAKKLAGMARKTLEKDGSSYMNITSLIQDVVHQVMTTRSLKKFLCLSYCRCCP